MDTTLFLAQLWGPVILAIGAGIFTSPNYYLKIYRDLEKEALAVLIFAMVAISAGIVQVSFHNVWSTLPEIVVSLLGWGLLAKGVMFAVLPKLVDKSGDWAADSKLVPAVGGFMLILGAYLSWIAFLA